MYRGYRVEGFFYTAFSIWMILESFCPRPVQFSFTAAPPGGRIPPPSKPSAIHTRGGRGLRASFPRDSIPPARRPSALPFAGKNGRKRKKRKRLTAQEEAPIRHRTGQPRKTHRQPARQTPTDSRPAPQTPGKASRTSRRQRNGRQPAQDRPAASKTANSPPPRQPEKAYYLCARKAHRQQNASASSGQPSSNHFSPKSLTEKVFRNRNVTNDHRAPPQAPFSSPKRHTYPPKRQKSPPETPKSITKESR